MYLNTKQDYLYAKENYPDWQEEYQKLLNGEYRWMDTGLVVGNGIIDATHKTVRSEMMGIKTVNQWEWTTDPGCRMYEIGFTRDEVSSLSGLSKDIPSPSQWTPYEPPEKTWDDIKTTRNTLLALCDWTQLTDAVLTLAEQTVWQDYRQTLRDIPQDFTGPDDVIFPVSPNEVQ